MSLSQLVFFWVGPSEWVVETSRGARVYSFSTLTNWWKVKVPNVIHFSKMKTKETFHSDFSLLSGSSVDQNQWCQIQIPGFK